MSQYSVIFHLKEAKEELERLLEEVENNGIDSFEVSMQHLYHHLNFAWNTRMLSDEQLAAETEEEYKQRENFPKDLDLN